MFDNVHIGGLNVHVWALKNSGYDLISSSFTTVGLDSYYWHLLCILVINNNRTGYGAYTTFSQLLSDP